MYMKKKLIFRFFIYIIIKTKSKMSNDTYDMALTIEEAKEMNLLDEVKFKYFKDYCEDDFIYGTAEYIIDSDILIGKNEVNIKLTLDWNEGIFWHEVEIHRIYSTSSPFALKMLDWIKEEDQELDTQSSSDEDDEYCYGTCGQKEIWDASTRHMCKTCDMNAEEEEN